MTTMFPSAGAADSSNAAAAKNNPQTIALAFAVASLQNPVAAAAAMEGLAASSASTIDTSAPLTIPQALLDAAAAAAAASTAVSAPVAQPAAAHGFSMEAPGSKVSSAPTEQPHHHYQHPVGSATLAVGMDNSTRSSISMTESAAKTEESSTTAANNNDEEDDNERRLARSRERNREHARRTRLRKKAQLEALQSKVKSLEAERQVLKQKVEECGIASILLGLSAGTATAEQEDEDTSSSTDASLACSTDMVAILSGSKRKRFISEAIGESGAAASMLPQQQRLVINVDGQVTEIGAGKSHINWKTGVYRDQQGVQRQLTPQQLEDLRRERNRMHAKMTRSRKKCFIATIQKAIDELETENQRMRDILDKVSSSSSSAPAAATPAVAPTNSSMMMVTPATSPQLSPKQAPLLHDDDDDNYSQAASDASSTSAIPSAPSSDSPLGGSRPLKKRKAMPAQHGFLLDG